MTMFILGVMMAVLLLAKPIFCLRNVQVRYMSHGISRQCIVSRLHSIEVDNNIKVYNENIPPLDGYGPPVMKKNGWLFTIMSAIAIAVSYADRSNLSTAIIPMAENFKWDSFFSGVVLSSFWAGYALTQILGGRLADKFGGEKLLAGAITLWSLCTYLTPYVAGNNQALLLVRVLLGAGEGLALPSIHSMLQKYVKQSEKSTSASIITAACYLGALVSNILSPLIIAKSNWETLFIAFAAIPPLIWLPLWYLFFIKNSARNENVSVTTAETTEVAVAGKASLRELLKSPPVWAIIAAQYGQSWGMIGLLSWLPTYYSQKFGVPIASLGSFTALPYLLQMIVAVAAGFAADKLIDSGYRVIVVRKVFQLIGMLAPALCLGYCSYAQLSAIGTAALITLGSAISALTVSSVSCNHFDIAPKNAGTVFGIGNTASCIGGLIAVPVSGFIYDYTHSWDSVFLLFAAHYIGGALVYSLFASDEPMAADK